MKEYMYNEFIEDVVLKVYDNMFDMTCIYDRETYEYIYSLIEYYYNNMILAKMRHNDIEQKCYDSIEAIHRITSYSTKLDNIEFMLLCDCINEINRVFNIDFNIDFDDYTDLENICMSFYDYNDAIAHRKEFAFYDFSYCKINITEYVRQYEKHDIYYYNAFEYDY